MESLIDYLSFVALVIVVILLAWSLLLAHREKSRKLTIRGRLAGLRKKIDDLPDNSDEDRAKKEILYRELILEYLGNILGEVELLRTVKAEKSKGEKKTKSRSKKK